METTEAEWLACADPYEVLRIHPHAISDRQLLLWGCACCRRVWDGLTSHRQKVVLVTELYADGQISQGELVASWDSSRSSAWDAWLFSVDPPSIARCAAYAAHTVALHAWSRCSKLTPARNSVLARIRSQEADLLRHTLGNPFHPIGVDPSWLSWNRGTVTRLARSIYFERRFDEMAILADALEEAGCEMGSILDHCRQPGDHLRGCWVLDLLLGREALAGRQPSLSYPQRTRN
jgi:hypothetical protein